MAIDNHFDHEGDVGELKAKLGDLFSHVQTWLQHAEKQQNAAEGLAELKTKTQRLLGLIEKAEQGMAAMATSAERLDEAIEKLDALGGDLKKTVGQSAAAVDAHLEASSQAIKKQFADLQQTNSEALSQAVAGQVSKLATAEQLGPLSTAEQVAKLATADQVKTLATREQLANLATAEQVANLKLELERAKEEIAKLATSEQVGKMMEHMKLPVWRRLLG